MGTSKSYTAPSGPQWTPLKGQITRIARAGLPSSDQAQEILNGFVRARGSDSSGGGGGAGGGSIAAGRAVDQRVGQFISALHEQGLTEALASAGLPDLSGKSASEIGLALVDYLGGAANTIDDVDARNALSDVMDEYLEEAESYEDVESVLDNLADEDELENFLLKFFSAYLFEQFNRCFYERLVEKFGAEKADSFMSSIKDYIRSAVKSRSLDKDLSKIDWNGQEGETVAEEILQDTLDIFGGES